MWYKSASIDKPPVMDDTSSKKSVYIRKDFEWVDGDEERPGQWEYLESKIDRDALELLNIIQNHDDAAEELYGQDNVFATTEDFEEALARLGVGV